MSTAVITKQIAEASPRLTARTAGLFYSLTFLTGGATLFARGRLGLVTGLAAAAFYLMVTVLLYHVFKPVNRSLSLSAALFSLVGCAIGPLGLLVPATSQINPLVFFGVYCLLIGYLIFRSGFLPQVLGVLMAFAGLGWLTFLSAPIAHDLYPYSMLPGLIGEGALTCWLLVKGVNVKRSQHQQGGRLSTAAREF